MINKSNIFAHQFLCFFQPFRINSSNDNIILYFITFFSPNLSVSTSSTYKPGIARYRNLEFELKIEYVTRFLIACNVATPLVPSARIFCISEMRSRMS